MFKNAFFLLILVFSFVTSCRSSRQVVTKNDTKSETLRERIVSYKDTTLFTPMSEASLKVPFNSMSFNGYLSHNETKFAPRTYTQRNGNATAKLRIETDTLYLTAKCDSIALRAQIKQEYQRDESHVKITQDTQENRTRGVSIFKLIIYLLLAFIAGFGTAFLLKTFKII